MDIFPLIVGSLATNCYLVSEGDSCVIIDPGADADFISTTILEKKLRPLAILLTHGHFDHCLASLELKLNFNLPIYLHQEDLFLYRQADKSSSYWTGEKTFRLPIPDNSLEDEQTLSLDGLVIKVIHTPGHTPGSVCFLVQDNLFTGDLLFEEGVGRTDFSYSDSHKLNASLNRLKNLPDNTLIYPGHENFSLPLHSILDIS